MTSASGKAVRTESPLLRRPILPYGKLRPNKETNSCAGHPCRFEKTKFLKMSNWKRRTSACDTSPQVLRAPSAATVLGGGRSPGRHLGVCGPRQAPPPAGCALPARRLGGRGRRARGPRRGAPRSRHSRHAAPCAQRLVAVRTAPWRSPAWERAFPCSFSPPAGSARPARSSSAGFPRPAPRGRGRRQDPTNAPFPPLPGGCILGEQQVYLRLWNSVNPVFCFKRERARCGPYIKKSSKIL